MKISKIFTFLFCCILFKLSGQESLKIEPYKIFTVSHTPSMLHALGSGLIAGDKDDPFTYVIDYDGQQLVKTYLKDGRKEQISTASLSHLFDRRAHVIPCFWSKDTILFVSGNLKEVVVFSTKIEDLIGSITIGKKLQQWFFIQNMPNSHIVRVGDYLVVPIFYGGLAYEDEKVRRTANAVAPFVLYNMKTKRLIKPEQSIIPELYNINNITHKKEFLTSNGLNKLFLLYGFVDTIFEYNVDTKKLRLIPISGLSNVKDIPFPDVNDETGKLEFELKQSYHLNFGYDKINDEFFVLTKPAVNDLNNAIPLSFYEIDWNLYKLNLQGKEIRHVLFTPKEAEWYQMAITSDGVILPANVRYYNQESKDEREYKQFKF